METAKKNSVNFYVFRFSSYQKKINLSLLEFFFSNKCSCTTALFFAVPTPKTTILLWLGKWVLNIQKNRKITISSIVYYKYYICFLNVMHCVCLCHYISPWWPLVLKKNLPNFRTLPLPRRHFESKAQESSSAWSSKICIGQSRNLCHDSLHEASKIAPHNFSLALSLAKKQGHSMLMPPGASTSSEAAAEFDKAKSLCENCLHMKTPCHGLIGKIWLLVNFRQ